MSDRAVWICYMAFVLLLFAINCFLLGCNFVAKTYWFCAINLTGVAAGVYSILSLAKDGPQDG